MQRALITAGVLLLVIGLAWPWIGKLGLGRLPGDIVIERENFRLYFPIITMVLISVVLSVVSYFIFRT